MKSTEDKMIDIVIAASICTVLSLACGIAGLILSIVALI